MLSHHRAVKQHRRNRNSMHHHPFQALSIIASPRGNYQHNQQLAHRLSEHAKNAWNVGNSKI